MVQAVDGAPGTSGYSQDDGDLPDDDLDGDAGEDPGDHRCREELGDPPETEQADRDQDGADKRAVKAMAVT